MPKVTLIRCGRCGKARGLFHECTSRRQGANYRLKPSLSFACPNCGKQITNPITHICRPKSDFRKRKKAAAKAAAKPKAKPQSHDRHRHDYQTCRDPDCPRFPCRVYREGWEEGYRQGRAAGYVAGYAAGYGDGIAAGYEKGYGDGLAAGQAGQK